MIRLAIAGVGNCASSLVQGIHYCRAHGDDAAGHGVDGGCCWRGKRLVGGGDRDAKPVPGFETMDHGCQGDGDRGGVIDSLREPLQPYRRGQAEGQARTGVRVHVVELDEQHRLAGG